MSGTVKQICRLKQQKTKLWGGGGEKVSEGIRREAGESEDVCVCQKAEIQAEDARQETVNNFLLRCFILKF